MPWSPDGPTTPVVDRLGWTPDGPDDPTPVPEEWSVVVVGEAGGDLGRGVDTAAGRALGTARDLGRGGDGATAPGVHATANPVSYKQMTLPTIIKQCRYRWSPED